MPLPSEIPPPRPTLPGNAYYDAAQLRADTWTRLRDATCRLNELEGGRRGVGAVFADVTESLALLKRIESYWSFPGKGAIDELLRLFDRGEHAALCHAAARTVRLLVGDVYRERDVSAFRERLESGKGDDEEEPALPVEPRPSFTVLLVDDIPPDEEAEARANLLRMRRSEDPFTYDVVVVPSFEDAVIAALFNHTIQSCVIRYSFPMRSSGRVEALQRYLNLAALLCTPPEAETGGRGVALGRTLKQLRPELDLFLVTDAPLDELAGSLGPEFRRVFYSLEDYRELHLSIMKGISERYDTPFFDALREYSQRPTGVFHALPISRGKSLENSHWIRDMAEFYGDNIFLAETSATGGGLDSLSQPSGPLKKAQELAARAFGARKTFFVTNGTSTANKVVVQALVRPGDIVLAARDCHKSHHYALITAGAHPLYMDPYPISNYSIYGGVPLREIKRHLLALRDAGRLDKARMVLMTNCTFDGITYDPFRVMQEVLAIKPDMVFVWDEAWFAFATFNPTFRRRTGMAAAAALRDLFRSDEYRRRYALWRADFDVRGRDTRAWLDEPLMADPDAARVRVYVTHSTHKTLTSLRQGSMIHVHDQDFERLASDAFHEAYMTHTSTSPNYQILASLDVGRRQVELEGYELVKSQIELAMAVRKRIHSSPLLRKHFRVLAAIDLIPPEYRPSGTEYYYDERSGFTRLDGAFRADEFAVDPTRITVTVGATGLDGDTLKRRLINDFDIQINKTSRNTLLFMTHIGTSRGTVAYLIEVLTRLARELDERLESQSPVERRLHEARVNSLTRELPPLPDFSLFHRAFRADPDAMTPEGDMRRAFYLAYDDSACECLKLGGEVERAMAAGRELVSACFVTPYPPGFPVLVPGQVLSLAILAFLKALDVREIHGYVPEHGLRVFTAAALTAAEPARSVRIAANPPSIAPPLPRPAETLASTPAAGA